MTLSISGRRQSSAAAPGASCEDEPAWSLRMGVDLALQPPLDVGMTGQQVQHPRERRGRRFVRRHEDGEHVVPNLSIVEGRAGAVAHLHELREQRGGRVAAAGLADQPLHDRVQPVDVSSQRAIAPRGEPGRQGKARLHVPDHPLVAGVNRGEQIREVVRTVHAQNHPAGRTQREIRDRVAHLQNLSVLPAGHDLGQRLLQRGEKAVEPAAMQQRLNDPAVIDVAAARPREEPGAEQRAERRLQTGAAVSSGLLDEDVDDVAGIAEQVRGSRQCSLTTSPRAEQWRRNSCGLLRSCRL